MTDIREFKTDELEKELERRKASESSKSRPTPLDFDAVKFKQKAIEFCEDCLTDFEERGYWEDDMDTYSLEFLFCSVYGDDFFKYTQP